MAQKPLKKIKLQEKETKYKKVLKKPKSTADLITKRINRGIVERFQTEYKAIINKKKNVRK